MFPAIPVPHTQADVLVLGIQGVLLIYIVGYSLRAFVNVEAVAAALAALLLITLSTSYGKDIFFIRSAIFLAKSSALIAFWVGVASSFVIALMVALRNEPAAHGVLVFIATAILFGGLFGASLLSEVAISGSAGKCIGLAVGHGLCRKLFA